MRPPVPGPAVRTDDGISLASWDLGGDGPPLLFLHPTGFHGRCWGPLAEELPGPFHCWALDQRGHGASDGAPDLDYSWRRFSTDVVAAIAVLDIPRPFVVGHSMGGAVALMAEAIRPGTFAAIFAYEPIVMNTTRPASPGAGGPPANGPLLAQLARRRRPTFASRPEALDNYSRKPPFARFRADALAAYVDGGFVDLPGGAVTLSCDPESEARVFEQAALAGIGDLVRASATPTFLACGDQDPVIGPESLEAIAAQLGASSPEVFSFLGHMGPFEDPGRIARAIDRAFRPAHGMDA